MNCIVSSQIFFSFVSEIKSIYLINGMFSKHEQAKCKKEDLNQQTHQPAMDRLNDNDDSLMWDLNWNNLYLGPQCRQKCGQSNTMQNTIHASNGSIVPIFSRSFHLSWESLRHVSDMSQTCRKIVKCWKCLILT